MEQQPTKIAFVEDRPKVMEFLVDTFKATNDFIVRGQYYNAEDAMAFLPQSEPAIVIVDIHLPGKSGIECVREVKLKRPDMLFMMFTVLDQDNELFESLKAGADGYLLKTTDEAEIIAAVRELREGGSPMTPTIARRVTKFFRQKQVGLKELSSRENEVLEKLANGLTYQEIGEQLFITEGTVKQHINKIYKKIHVSNRTEATNKWFGRRKK